MVGNFFRGLEVECFIFGNNILNYILGCMKVYSFEGDLE